MTELWKGERRANAKRLIDELLRRRTDGGWEVGAVQQFGMAELANSSTDPESTQRFALKTLSEMHERGLSEVSDFESQFESIMKARAALTGRTKQKWHFILPIDLRLDASLKRPISVHVSGRGWYLIPHQSMETLVGRRPLRSPSTAIFRNRTVDWNYQTFLSTTCESKDWDSAWTGLQPSFDLLRGWIEFTLGFGSFRVMSSDQGPRGKVPHPPWVIGKPEAGKPEGVTFILHPRKRPTSPPRVDGRFLQALRANARSLKNAGDHRSVDSLLEGVVRLYAQAMDEYFNYACLLGLWQIAESIAQPHKRTGDTAKVCHRLCLIGRGTPYWGSGWKYSLDRISSIRNDIVHRGMRDVADSDVALLKIVVDSAIQWLYQSKDVLGTRQHLEYFYVHADLDNTSLGALAEAVSAVQKSRL